MIVRCKFYCDSVTKTKQSTGFGYTARFYAVHSGSPENAAFFKYTPSATLELQTIQRDYFEVGKEYYLDITLAEAPVLAQPQTE